MIIEEFKLKNFRSFKEEATIKFNKDINTVIGENNAGKSAIFVALDKMRLFMRNNGNMHPKEGGIQHAIFRKSDWTCENEEPMNLKLTITLSDEEKIRILEPLISSYEIKEYEKEEFSALFSKKMEFNFLNKYGSNMSRVYIKIGDFYLCGQELALNQDFFINKRREIINIDFSLLVKKINDLPQNVRNRFDFEIKNSLAKNLKASCIRLNSQLFYEGILSLFVDNFKLFSDIRQRPENKEQRVSESMDGREVAALLFSLKNSKNPSKQKYSKIQQEFKKYFPDMNLDVAKTYEDLEITISSSKNNHEHPLDQAGAGILEFIIVLVNLVGSDNKIFVFQEPEIHLHQSAQKALFRLIYENSTKNQVVIVSHSPNFINIKEVHKNILVKKLEDTSRIYQINENFFEKRELSRIYTEFLGNNKEIFFANGVILVEGQTELGAIPVFAQNLEKDLDILNLFVCWVGGKKGFLIYQKVLEAFNIPYYIVYDKDAYNLQNILNHNSKLCLDPDFEGFLKSKGNGFENLFTEAISEGLKGKPQIGRFVAEKISVENIPDEIKNVISEITKMTR